MRLKINFGLIDTKIVNWYRPFEHFPNLINYLGRNYEWVTYDTDPTGQVDQILTFSALMTYDPNYGVVCTKWTDLFSDDYDKCECGASFTSFSWDHMRMCKKWRPW